MSLVVHSLLAKSQSTAREENASFKKDMCMVRGIFSHMPMNDNNDIVDDLGTLVHHN